jgi:thioredoxin 1
MRLPIPPLQQELVHGRVDPDYIVGNFIAVQKKRNWQINGDPDGIRTRVAALKGPCPRPLDDGATSLCQRCEHLRRHAEDSQVRTNVPARGPFFAGLSPGSIMREQGYDNREIKTTAAQRRNRKVIFLMASQNVMEFGTNNWDQEVAKSDLPVLVDFWAPWCGPCRALTPTIEKLATQFAGKIKVGKLNTDDNQDVAIKYGITNIPQVLIFKGGEQKERMVGLQSESAFVKVINRVLEG